MSLMRMEDRVESVKARLPIATIISLTDSLTGEGKWLKGVEKSSLVVNTEENKYFWNDPGEFGDAITWAMNHVPINEKTLEHDPVGGTVGVRFTVALAFLEKFVSGNIPEGYTYKPVTREKVPPDVSLVEEYHNNLLNDPIAQSKWHERGVGEWHWTKWKLGYKYNHWGRGPGLSIPFYEGGVLRTIRHRILNPIDHQRYMPEKEGAGSWVFNIDVVEPKLKELWVIEGEIKCIVASTYDIPAIGLAGINMLDKRYHDVLAHIPKLYVVPDPVVMPKKPHTPHDISWVKALAEKTEVRLVILPEKIDDFLMTAEDSYKALIAAKRFAPLVKP
jgi:hypothetical protein